MVKSLQGQKKAEKSVESKPSKEVPLIDVPLSYNIYTYGSTESENVQIIYPKWVDLVRWTRFRGENDVVIPDLVKIHYKNEDSNKNLGRTVDIEEIYSPIVIRDYGKKRGEPFSHVYLVYPNGKGVELEQKSETVEEQDGKYNVIKQKYYVEVNGEKVYFAERELERELAPEKLKVIVRSDGRKVLVFGDTYPIKDKLKAMGARWDPINKIWFFSDADMGQIASKIRELGINVEEH
jgi:cellobiose-specific phosphotransferase system component IIB